MFKRGMALALGLAALIWLGTARGDGYPADVSGIRAAALIEQACGKVALNYNGGEKLSAGGLSRLPALLAVCEKIDGGALSAKDTVTVSPAAAGVPGPTVFIEAGERVPVSLLLQAGAMICAGDAIYALAEAAYGSPEACARDVNRIFGEMGVDVNYTGIGDADMLFSALDMAKIGARLMDSGSFRLYSGVFYDTVRHEDGRGTELASSNRLLKSCAGTNGVGTGSSPEAGYCGVFSVQRGGSCFICALLGAGSSSIRAEKARSMIEYGFAAYDVKRLAGAGEVMAEGVPVKRGTAGSVALAAREDAVALVPKNVRLEEKREIPEYLEAPVSRNEPAGRITYSAGGETVAAVELVPGEDIAGAAAADYIRMALMDWLHA